MRMYSLSVNGDFAIKALKTVCLVIIVVIGFMACSTKGDTTEYTDFQTISDQLAAVRDYVPLYALIAHRGCTFVR